MKRIITIDVLRGLAIILMILFHTWLNVMDQSILNNLDLSEMNPILAILAVIFFFLGRSRTLFLFISAIIHQYTFMKSLKEGKSPEHLLYRGIIKGVIVYLLGVFREGILSPWGPINSFILTGEVSKTAYRLAYICETLQIIGLSIIFLSVVSYIFFKKQWHKDTVLFVSVLSVLALLFLFLAPDIHESVNALLGYDLTKLGSFNQDFKSTAEYFTRFFWMSIAGVESPIFPNFFVTCVGGIFGLLLTMPKLDKKFVRYSALVGTLFILFGVLHLIFIDDMNIDFWFRIFPTWYMLTNMGLQIYLLTALLALFEFRTKANLKRYARWTRYIRRWSIVSLTVYMIQFADLFIRMICSNLIGVDFTTRHQQGFGWSIYMMFIAFLFFDVIIRIWERFRYIGTFEWILIQLTRLLVGRKKYTSVRIKVKESLYEVEPISFARFETVEEDWISSKIEIRDSQSQGKGMFAKELIKEGEEVVIWGITEYYKTKEEAEKAAVNGKIYTQFDEDLFVISDTNTRDEDLTHFMNHSCDSNTWMKDATTITAKRDIKEDEEVTIDYALFESTDEWIGPWECKCGSTFCRKQYTGKDWMKPELQERYKGHFSPYNNKRIARILKKKNN